MTARLELAYERMERPGATQRAVFLHGILGSGPNLRTLARRFLDAHPGYDAWLVDLRGHGHSPKGTPSPSLEAAARDVMDTFARSDLPPTVLVGHSFGGKVALEMLRLGFGAPGHLTNVEPPTAVALRHCFVLDSLPGVRTTGRGSESTLAVLGMLDRLPKTYATRDEFVALVTKEHPRALAQWLGMNLEREGDGFRLALDLAEIRGLLDSYFAADLWPVIASPPGEVSVHLVIAEGSTVYDENDRERASELVSPRVTVDFVPGGHWVHVEALEQVLRVMDERVR